MEATKVVEGDSEADSVQSPPRLLGRAFMQFKSVGQQAGRIILSHARAVNASKPTDCSGYVPHPTVRNIPSSSCFLAYKDTIARGCE